MTHEIIYIAIGLALGWALHLARSGTAHDLPIEQRILSITLDKPLLDDMYIIFNNLSLGMRKSTVTHRIVLTVLLAINNSKESIERGICQLKKKFPKLLIPNSVRKKFKSAHIINLKLKSCEVD